MSTSSNNNPLNGFMAQLIQEKAARIAHLSLVNDNARITRVDGSNFSISGLSRRQIKSARHQTSRWSETKSSTSVPYQELRCGELSLEGKHDTSIIISLTQQEALVRTVTKNETTGPAPIPKPDGASTVTSLSPDKDGSMFRRQRKRLERSWERMVATHRNS
jgi:hypothetical protein